MKTVAAVLAPAGLIAEKELTLMFDVVALMLITATAVFALAIFFAVKYRAGNSKAVYLPNWEHGAMNELIWWAIPIEIVLILGALTWTSSHELDPHKELLVGGAPLTVEVVALPWKWLFIYPEEDIAVVNALYLPVGRPLNFKITADAPMNSFWIPELGGQIYAMTGMVTELRLLALREGVFRGSSANYSGEGFAEMAFDATAVSAEEFVAWVAKTQESTDALTQTEYEALAKPSTGDAPHFYGSVAPGLFDAIVLAFMSAPNDYAH